ncbi:MAG: glycogen-binding domain-containing protein [Deltaproteobacteria bacterium]|nr:glycogen-binding domain-containing protein [Deltaproteobacteria bacterium]
MKNGLISLYIDDEMDLEEKVRFVETIRADGDFAGECLALLHQEQLLGGTVTEAPVFMPLPEPKKRWNRFFPARAIGWASAATLAAVLIVVLLPFRQPVTTAAVEHRFIVYQPEAKNVEIMGTFTGWKRISLAKSGSGGYWEITLPLSPAEHRFSYVADGTERFADPTVQARERDDYGSVNSVITVEHRA